MVVWEERNLGVIRWETDRRGRGRYVLEIPRQPDLPLSFDVHAKVGRDVPDLSEAH